MIFAMMMALAVQDAPCVNPDTLLHRRQIESGRRPSCEQMERDSIRAETPNRDVTAADERRVKTFFDDILLDGPSARWRFDFVYQGHRVCGAVNAKNRFGAYAGWQPFSFDLDAGRGNIGSGGISDALVSQSCGGPELNLS